MGMFSQTEIFLMIGVVGVLLVVIVVLTILDIKDYRKNVSLLKNDEEIDDNEVMAEEVKEPIKTEEILISDISEENTSLETHLDEIVIEEVSDDNIVLEEVEEPLIMQEDIQENRNILEEELNKTLETMPNEDNLVTTFEEEQERTAIISLDELMSKTNEIYSENEMMQYDDGNAPITIDEVINKYNKEQPIISSFYGIEQSNQNLEFENTATYEKLSRETKNEFLAKLREINENK